MPRKGVRPAPVRATVLSSPASPASCRFSEPPPVPLSRQAGLWGLLGGIALASGLAALAGNLALAGAILADTMIPAAFETAHDYAGLITVAGFLLAFALAHLGGD